ncbi:MAG: hypothetical protein M3134_05520 [Actinomycetota bacterium]|nr:hypothetical protein [Actinomycetota bacterium]
MTRIGRIALPFLLAVSSLAPSATAGPARPGSAAAGLEPVASVEYPDGMHLAVTRIKGRDYVFASASTVTPGGGIRVFDVTSPAKPKVVATIPCSGGQGFLDLSHDNKTLIVGEGRSHPPDPCMPEDAMGIYTIDVSNPRKPKPLGYALAERAAHHLDAHPTKPIVYVAHGDPALTSPNRVGAYEVWSIANPAKPKLLTTAKVTGYHGPHDFAFNADGTRAIASSMTALQVLDTSDPANPKELEVLQCPGCSHNHEAHFTPDQKHVVVSDETTGGIVAPCPLGALYFYEWDAKGPEHMTLVGEWQPAEAVTPADEPTNAPLCTSHVFGISADGTKVAASWHNAGVRVIDISEMAGVGVGDQGTGAKELGWHVAPGADAWSAKFDRTGRYVFVNDANLGFQVFELKS